MPRGDKAYVSGFTISLGPMEVVGDLLTPKVTGSATKDALKNICPTCEEPHVMKQKLFCDSSDEHGPFVQGDCDKAKDVDGNLVRVSAEEAKGARESELPPGYLEVNAHQAEEVVAKTMESGASYVFRPSGSGKLYGLLLDLIEKRDDVVFMGQVNLRKQDKLVRLTRGLNNQLIITELVWPEDLKEFNTPEYEYKPALLKTAGTLVDQTIKTFDQDDYKKAARERVAALVEAKASGKEAPKPVKAVSKMDDDDSLAALLEAAVAK